MRGWFSFDCGGEVTTNTKLRFVKNRRIITGAMILNHFLAYLLRSRGAVLSIVLYLTTVLFSTIICYFSKPYPGFLEVSDFIQNYTQNCCYYSEFLFYLYYTHFHLCLEKGKVRKSCGLER